MDYRVTIYAVVRYPVSVSAPDQRAALVAADEVFNPPANWADEIVYYLVDEVGDENFARSEIYFSNHRTWDERVGAVAQTLDIDPTKLSEALTAEGF